MNRPLNILLIEDEQDICLRFKDTIDEFEDITLIGMTDNSYDALELTKNYLPDAVILDLELHYGHGNGLLFLQELKNLQLSVFPYLLVTTNNSSPTTYHFIRKLGVDFIMYKYQEDYSETKVISFLRMMTSIIYSNQKRNNPLYAISETPFERKKRIKRIISKELDSVGINPKFLGYQYLSDAILITLDESPSNITTILSKKYHKTSTSIKRAMQSAINHAWHTADIGDLLLHYTAKINSDKGVPTIMEFVCYYATKIKNEH